MIKVLMVLYFFPPSVGPAIQRGLKFCKYMNKFGYKPYILTGKPSKKEVQDPGLLQDMSGKEYEIFRIPKFDFSGFNYQQKTEKFNKTKLKLFVNIKVLLRNMIIPDKAVFWGILALKKAKKIIKEENIRIVFTSFFPGTAHFIGMRLKRMNKDITWVADFRDSWMTDPTVKRRFINRVVNILLEKKVLKYCDIAVFVNDTIAGKYTNNHPVLNGKTAVISNGFDFDDLQMLPPEDGLKKSGNRIIIIHAGTLSQTRTPDKLLQAISDYNTRNDGIKKFKFISVGSFYSELSEKMIKTMQENDYLEIISFVPKKKLYELYSGADIIAVIINQSPGSEEIQTGKLFEVISLNKKVLLVGPKNGEAEKLIRETEVGVVARYDDLNEIKLALTTLIQNNSIKPRKKEIAKYSSENNTKKLCSLFDTLRKRD